MTLWSNVSLVGESVTGCYTTVVITVQIHLLYMDTLYLKGSHTALLVIVNHYGRSKYTTQDDTSDT